MSLPTNIGFPWMRLQRVFSAQKIPLKLVLEHIPPPKGKTQAQLWLKDYEKPLSDLEALSKNHPLLSENQKQALLLLAQCERSNLKGDTFVITSQQMERFLYLMPHIAIEWKSKGYLSFAEEKASFKIYLHHQLMSFIIQDAHGHTLEPLLIFGNEQTYILDAQLRVHLLKGQFLPGEVVHLSTLQLSVEGLKESGSFEVFCALIQKGLQDQALSHMALPCHDSTLWVRPILKGSPESGFHLRIHLVTQLTHDDHDHEVEVPSSGPFSSFFPCSQGNDFLLLKRPSEKEHEARQALLDLGLFPAYTHAGFEAHPSTITSILYALTEGQALPSFVQVDKEVMPNWVRLPSVIPLKTELTHSSQLQISYDFSKSSLGFSLKELMDAYKKQEKALLLPDQTFVTFEPETLKAFSKLEELLGLSDFSVQKTIPIDQASLIFHLLSTQIQLKCSKELQTRIAGFIPQKLPSDETIPECLQTSLRPYQHEALIWMSQMHRSGLGFLLADDMGLGKTLMVLAMLAKIKEQEGSKTSLVVCPTSVLDVWVKEAKHHLAAFKILKWHGGDRNHEQSFQDADLVITSYGLLRRDLEKFRSYTFNYLILDEAQQTKNSRTETWKSARLIDAKHRLGISGTPIENHVSDLWSILEILQPGILGSETSFDKNYLQPISQGDMEKTQELKRRVYPLILRRTKKEVEKELPEKIENIIYCPMQADQAALYKKILESIRHQFETGAAQGFRPPSQISLLAALTKLRQVCCDPRLILKTNPLSSAKQDALRKILQDFLEMNRKIIIYSQFVTMQKYIHQLLQDMGIKDTLWLHGGTRNRQEIVDRFQDEQGPSIIVVSLKAGGVGITLTRADTVILYDPWWNPAVEDQAIDRAHRIGQSKSVHVIKLICPGTIEEQMLQLSQKKRSYSDQVLTLEKTQKNIISMEEIEQLLKNELERL